MKVCITGALGHIGSAFIRHLNIKHLEKVYLVDNFLTQRYVSLFDLPEGIPFSFHEIDILSEDMETIIKDSDVVIHLAAVTNAEASFHNADMVEEVNKKGVERIAQLCAKYQAKLMFPSSTSVYGVQEGLVDENCSDADLKPQSPYADSKLHGEKFLQSLKESDGLNYVVYRLGTIFGYSIGMRFHTAVNKFIWQSCAREPITVWRTAWEQKRPYCDLMDCVDALNYTINEDVFDGEIYNILTTNLTVKDIVETIQKYVPDLEVKYVDSPIMNQLSYNISTEKSLARGFSYHGNLDHSIKECINKLKRMNT